ncbi:hypothetical protein AMTRI_Chr07g77640 [Amborella trichopoda]
MELITGSRKTSNLYWPYILFLGSLGFLLVGTSSYLRIVMYFYGIAGLFISSYLWCTILWNVGSSYDRFDRKDGIVCIFRWGFPGRNRRNPRILFNIIDLSLKQLLIQSKHVSVRSYSAPFCSPYAATGAVLSIQNHHFIKSSKTKE